jgi:hypothetical protein
MLNHILKSEIIWGNIKTNETTISSQYCDLARERSFESNFQIDCLNTDVEIYILTALEMLCLI